MRLLPMIAATLFALACLGVAAAGNGPPAPIAGAVVKIEIATAEGSGVHIGHGLVLTAAHVVRDEAEVTITTDRGDELPGEVLWSHGKHDLAMIRSPQLVAQSSDLACRPLVVGEPLAAKGYALGMAFVHVWGRVAAPASPLGESPAIVLADMTAAPGMSGGPAYDGAGRLAAIMLAVSKSRLGSIPLSWLLPAEAICKVLAEAEEK